MIIIYIFLGKGGIGKIIIVFVIVKWYVSEGKWVLFVG